MKQFNSPLEAFLHWENVTPTNLFFVQHIDGKTKDYSYKKAGIEIRKIAARLNEYNFDPKSHIALISKNCAHWMMADLAIMMSGHVSIPIYPTLNAQSINQIVTHSESKAIFVGKLDNYNDQKSGIPDIPRIGVELFGINEQESWENIVNSEIELQHLHTQKKDDLHTIIYTSGTTGNPKGVMHTVENFMTSVYTVTEVFKTIEHPRFFSYLPLAHVAERLIMTYGISLGAQISFSESLQTFAADLEATQPHTFFAVPRIWTKFQEKILEKIPQKKLSLLLSIPVVKNIIKSKLQHKLGLKAATVMLSGAAPLSKDVIDWYGRLGIEILQAYGMTEDCCMSHYNLIGANKVGTVGRALPGVQVKFTSEGEILIKNNSMMKGYFKAPEMTNEVLRKDGYLHTGDMGEYDHDGYLTITGRAKDQFKTDKGKYISPAPIELQIAENPDIEQICIVGTGIPQPIALIILSELGKQKSNELVSESLNTSINVINPSLEKHENIEKMIVMKEEWTVDNGLLTPTLKVRRNSIEKIHQGYYKSWFESTEKVVFE